uniref:Uncharacterized protein n=1 Tax=Bracon brevicornis TaxID=1563983 RepID=A0A6V7IP31_9HYME
MRSEVTLIVQRLLQEGWPKRTEDVVSSRARYCEGSCPFSGQRLDRVEGAEVVEFSEPRVMGVEWTRRHRRYRSSNRRRRILNEKEALEVVRICFYRHWLLEEEVDRDQTVIEG